MLKFKCPTCGHVFEKGNGEPCTQEYGCPGKLRYFGGVVKCSDNPTHYYQQMRCPKSNTLIVLSKYEQGHKYGIPTFVFLAGIAAFFMSLLIMGAGNLINRVLTSSAEPTPRPLGWVCLEEDALDQERRHANNDATRLIREFDNISRSGNNPERLEELAIEIGDNIELRQDIAFRIGGDEAALEFWLNTREASANWPEGLYEAIFLEADGSSALDSEIVRLEKAISAN